MSVTRREMLRDIGILAAAGMGSRCGVQTREFDPEYVSGRPIHDFLTTALQGICIYGQPDELEWVIGSRRPIQEDDRAVLEGLRNRIETLIDGCQLDVPVLDYLAIHYGQMIIYGSRESNHILNRVISEEDLPSAGTGLIKTIQFSDGSEALCLVGRDVEARSAAAEVVWGFIMSYIPLTDDDGDSFRECNTVRTTYDGSVYRSDASIE